MARIAAKVKVTHKMLGARSTLETAVGSRPKLNTTSTSTTKTAAERIAVRERNSTSRSLEATAQAWRRSLGDCIAIVLAHLLGTDRKSTRLNSSHTVISYAVFCLKKKKKKNNSKKTIINK